MANSDLLRAGYAGLRVPEWPPGHPGLQPGRRSEVPALPEVVVSCEVCPQLVWVKGARPRLLLPAGLGPVCGHSFLSADFTLVQDPPAKEGLTETSIS